MVAVALPLRLRGAAAGVWFAGGDCSGRPWFWNFCRLDLRGEDDDSVGEGCGGEEGFLLSAFLLSAAAFLFRDGGGCVLEEADWARLGSGEATGWSAAD